MWHMVVCSTTECIWGSQLYIAMPAFVLLPLPAKTFAQLDKQSAVHHKSRDSSIKSMSSQEELPSGVAAHIIKASTTWQCSHGDKFHTTDNVITALNKICISKLNHLATTKMNL